MSTYFQDEGVLWKTQKNPQFKESTQLSYLRFCLRCGQRSWRSHENAHGPWNCSFVSTSAECIYFVVSNCKNSHEIEAGQNTNYCTHCMYSIFRHFSWIGLFCVIFFNQKISWKFSGENKMEVGTTKSKGIDEMNRSRKFQLSHSDLIVEMISDHLKKEMRGCVRAISIVAVTIFSHWNQSKLQIAMQSCKKDLFLLPVWLHFTCQRIRHCVSKVEM